ncbi:sialidase family protein [Ruegeria sp. EL01]|uniref:sialidase family protein n=1 Tax=Ruegeria sp. EL01 TaxID=2107578 RepID=UPI0013C50B89|nr:sialidase family protein [Ruegeria sp. EL01]
MSPIKDITHHTMVKHPEHCVNQTMARVLKNGDLVAVYNEERYPFHHDSGRSMMVKSTDGGQTWGEPSVIVDWSDTTGNWDAGICELDDGTLLVNFAITGFFKRGQKPTQPSWGGAPNTKEWGDWTWAFKLQSWLGTYVVKSKDGGQTWSSPIPVNVRPMKHGGCRSGCWQLPDGGILMGLYGRIRGYGEEGENEATRSALMRSDDGGDNWEYYSTLAYDPAAIIDYEEPDILRLKDGRLVCFMRTHVNPSGDAKNMVMTISEDDGFSWTPPKWTNIWGYPPELIPLQDGRYLMVYGYRRPSYGVRGIISEDGVTWDVKDEFIIREGGLPTRSESSKPTSSLGGDNDTEGYNAGTIDPNHPGLYQHIGYPSVVQNPDGSIAVSYHEWSDDPVPLQYLRTTRFWLS